MQRPIHTRARALVRRTGRSIGVSVTYARRVAPIS
jgi:hypothetical protein